MRLRTSLAALPLVVLPLALLAVHPAAVEPPGRAALQPAGATLIDPARSRVGFTISKLGYSDVEGTFGDFDVDLLEAMALDGVSDTLEEAARARIIRPDSESDSRSDSEARYVFEHELIRQTLLEDLSVPRRRRLHLEIGNALEHVVPLERQGRRFVQLLPCDGQRDSRPLLAAQRVRGHHRLAAVVLTPVDQHPPLAKRLRLA